MKLALASAGIILGLTACAPRNSLVSHYDRWAKQDEVRKVEEAAEAKKEADFKAFVASGGAVSSGGGSTGGAPGGAKTSGGGGAPPPPPPPPPAPPPAYDGYNSLGSSSTPPVTKTATKSKVVQPAEDEDIY